jgi:subtilisin family serine protease
MKTRIKALALAVALVCGSVQAQSEADVAKYRTTEYWATTSKSDDFLSAIKAEYAYARGFTGKGVTVGVIDTGVNLQNVDLIGRVKAFYDPLKLGANDVVGHGTHVAGIIAANKNNYGMQGVAYDTSLFIVKVTNSTSFNSTVALQGMQMAVMSGASVINWSAGVTFDSAYVKSIRQVSPGIFTSSSTVFGGSNYYGLESPAAYASALGKNAIMVVAAGNSGLKFPENPASFATAVDTKGNLLLGGQMIIAGNYDLQYNRINPTSNLAGHVCKNLVASVCKDPYVTSDFYLLAPGTNITSTYGTGYAMMSGTSMAAPVITGAAAVLKQQWPYLSGSAIVQILLKTANKNLPGYSVETHGQGMVDLEKATRPVGTISVPTAGNVAGASLPIGNITVNTGTAKLSGIGPVAVTDEFTRVYYTTLTPAENNKSRTLLWDPMSAAKTMAAGTNLGAAGTVLDFQTHTVGPMSITTGLAADGKKGYIEASYDFKPFTLGVGNLNETESWLGNTSSGSFGAFNGSSTNLVYLGLKETVGTVDLSARYTVGFSSIRRTNTEFVQLPSSAASSAWQLQARTNYNPDTAAGIGIQQPLTVTRAQMSVRAATTVDDDGNLNYENFNTNLAAEHRQVDAYGYVDARINKDTSVYLFANRSQNYLNQPGVSASQVGVLFGKKF